MNIRYDPTVDALYIDLARGDYEVSKKITDRIVVDVTKKGKVLGIEILDASQTIQSFDPRQIVSRFQRSNTAHAAA